MKKYLKLCVPLICFVLMFTGSTLQAGATTVKINSWYLIDSGGHLDWDGSTTYIDFYKQAVKVWNNYKSGVICEDTVWTIEDVKISDCYDDNTTTAATTSGNTDTIKFNTYIMNKLGGDQIRNVCIHELGHALGLAHNTSSDVMYKYVTTINKLSANDKASYDASFKRI
ncbi:MAG: matrixin family metalloprotease [Ruminococcus sp.]|nr:matrixin family metalloprotease [Ruminococcus sp.]